MTSPEAQRLIRVEEKQKAMTQHIAELTKTLKTNTEVTAAIKESLDELTGAKKFLIWFTSFIAGIGIIIATVYAAVKDAHR